MAFTYNSQLDAFELYHQIQEDNTAGQSDHIGLPALGHALAGSAGTAISHLILYPLDLAITRLQVQRQLRGPNEAPSAAAEADIEYRSISDAVRKIYATEGGLSAFYAGCLTDTSKSIVDSFLFFLAYTFLRQRRQNSRGTHSLPVLDELSIGMAAGAFSKFVTTPIQQIVTRKQTASLIAARDPTASLPPTQTRNLSIRDIALQIRSERGVAGFWAGYSASLILTLNPSLTFVFHNLLNRFALPKSRRADPGTVAVFLLAALSKAAATSVMYPVSLAKTRAQIGSTHASAGVDAPRDEDEKRQRETSQDRRTGRVAFIAKYVRQPAVLVSLRKIIREEGIKGLYAGLEGEVAKGFLGHGLTMLLKEHIHGGIVALYFWLLKVSKRWPEGNMSDARAQATKEMERVRRIVTEKTQDAGDSANTMGGKVGEAAKGAQEYAGSAASDTGQRVQNVATTIAEGVKNAVKGED